MDKETQRNMLVAIVLSLLIMIVWNHFFPPKTSRQQVSPQKQIEHVYEQPAEPPRVGFESVAAKVSPEVRAEAKDVVVETKHFHATFRTLGGDLVSLRLPEYSSKRGGKVELVPQGTETQLPLSLQFHSSEFGTQTEDFVYDSALYSSSDPALQNLTEEAARIASGISPGSTQAQVRQYLEEHLPRVQGQEDLRALVIADLSNNVPPENTAQTVSARAQYLREGQALVFSHQMTPSLRLIKGFIFNPNEYHFVMYNVFRNTGDATLKFDTAQPSYSIVWAPGMESPETTAKGDELVGIDLVGKNYTQKPIRKLKEEKEFSEELKWIGLKRKYFFATLQPNDGVLNAQMDPLGQKQELVGIRLNMLPFEVAPHEQSSNSVRICAGPMLKSVLESCGPSYGQILNFGFFDMFGKWLLTALLWFNKYVHNYGLAIILLTIVTRLALFPLNQKSYRSMRSMQALQPKVNELREKYKKNPQEMNKKMMELYRENKVNPMGGCLPIAFQMPIFIALFQALRNAVELRGANFLWMADLSEPDNLFTITQPFHFSLNLLPLLVIVAMLVQQKMTPMAGGGQNEAQQKMMQYMPVIFGFLFYSMPSGLTVYFLVSTVLGLVQQYFVQKGGIAAAA